ncbi:hypothetical protein ACHAXT_011716 [Thalassiosira profunda]
MALVPCTGPPKWALLELISEHNEEAVRQIEKLTKELESTEAPLNEVLEKLFTFCPAKLITFQHEAATLRGLEKAWLKLDTERLHEDIVRRQRRRRLQIYTDNQLDIIGSFVESALKGLTKLKASSKEKSLEWFAQGQLALQRETVLTKLHKPDKSHDLWLICNMG